MPLTTTNPQLIFHQSHNPNNLGWCIANIFEHNNSTIAVLSEKFHPDGEYNDGPDETYSYSLTNGLEMALTALRAWLGRKPDIVIHFTPERRRPGQRFVDPENVAQYCLITLVWDQDSMEYREIPGIHPWQDITKDAFEALIGQNIETIPV